jgi:methyl halide transferase
MNAQLIDNWNELYRGGRIPQWEDLEYNSQFCDFIIQNSTPEMQILELGAGLGHNALYLAKYGLQVTASDLSSNAMARCEKLVNNWGVNLNCRTIDVFALSGNEGKFHLIYEKGCWHTFFNDLSRTLFAERVASLLIDDGLWISSSGSADNNDDPNDPHLNTYPRLTLQQIGSASEGCFKVMKIQKGWYGHREENSFLTWECLFQKRANQAFNSDG